VYERNDDTSYEGKFVNGVMNGEKFVIHWRTPKVIYEGQVAANKLNGPGMMTYSDDTKIEGIWKNDKLDREQDHKLILKDGSIVA
jgi:hypothetical protein